MENWELPAISGADPPPEVGAAVDRIQQELLRRRATAWVQQAVHASGMAVPGSGGAGASTCSGIYEVGSGSTGVGRTVSLCTQSVLPTFHAAAPSGLVVCELFGGICAGLEMVLRNGIPLFAYIYVDNDLVCQSIAAHRIQQLMAQYPHLLPATAVAQAFTSLPHDVWLITPSHLQALSYLFSHQWLVVGGVGIPGYEPSWYRFRVAG